jgi:hypothetical protein
LSSAEEARVSSPAPLNRHSWASRGD